MIGVLVAVVGWLWTATTDTPVVEVPVAPAGTLFGYWTDDEKFDCKWWPGDVYYATDACSTFAITRISSGDMNKAIERAIRCAVHGETACVISGEVGFSVPTAFLYDHTGMSAMIAPRLLDGASKRKVKLQDPTGAHPTQIFEFNNTITAEFLRGGSRSVETRELTGDAAYCVQALRRSIAPSCWSGLD
jgi:hypothetical protein